MDIHNPSELVSPTEAKEPVWALAPLTARCMAHCVDSFVALLLFLTAIPIRSLGATAVLIGAGMTIGYYLLADLPGVPSVGKKLFNLHVLDSATWIRCSPTQVLIRNICRLLGPFDWGPIFGEQRQRLGDRLARTVVAYDMFA